MTEEELKAMEARWKPAPRECYCGHDPCWGCRHVNTVDEARKDIRALFAEVRRLRATVARVEALADVMESGPMMLFGVPTALKLRAALKGPE